CVNQHGVRRTLFHETSAGLFSFAPVFFFFKQKTAYDVVGSDWSSDVCSSDLFPAFRDAGLITANGRTVTAWKRSEERRVGKECYQPCRARWSPYHEKKNRI